MRLRRGEGGEGEQERRGKVCREREDGGRAASQAGANAGGTQGSGD